MDRFAPDVKSFDFGFKIIDFVCKKWLISPQRMVQHFKYYFDFGLFL
jgi:hypothetical protein